MGAKLGKNNTYVVSGGGSSSAYSSRIEDDDRRSSEGSMNFSGSVVIVRIGRSNDFHCR